MERVDGHLERGEKTVVNDVLACFDVRGGKWDGQLIIPPGAPIEESGYVLVLDDGRKGEILVNTVNHRHGQPAPDVWFEGKGTLA